MNPDDLRRVDDLIAAARARVGTLPPRPEPTPPRRPPRWPGNVLVLGYLYVALWAGQLTGGVWRWPVVIVLCVAALLVRARKAATAPAEQLRG